MSHQCYEEDNKLSKSLKICDSLVTFSPKGGPPALPLNVGIHLFGGENNYAEFCILGP